MHSPQTTPRGVRRWTPAIVALAVAGIMGLLFVVLASRGAVTARVGTAPTATLGKVQIGNEMMATQQALAREYGPKKTVVPQPPVTPPSSCPIGSIPNQIILPDGLVHEDTTNVAIVGPTASVPYKYVIYAGALRENPQQGIMVVMSTPEDPCKNPTGGTQGTYRTPYQKGALTITKINATSVSFSIADGGTGQFNFVTNQFS
jgi:hypothetical protein